MSEKAAKKAPTRKTGASKPAAKKTRSKAQKEKLAEKAETKSVERMPAPAPFVMARHERGMHEREARGYSLGELETAGMGFIVARRARVPIDMRRRSVLEGNVGRLKEWYVPEPAKARTETSEKPEKPEKPAKKAASRAKNAAKTKKE